MILSAIPVQKLSSTTPPLPYVSHACPTASLALLHKFVRTVALVSTSHQPTNAIVVLKSAYNVIMMSIVWNVRRVISLILCIYSVRLIVVLDYFMKKRTGNVFFVSLKAAILALK